MQPRDGRPTAERVAGLVKQARSVVSAVESVLEVLPGTAQGSAEAAIALELARRLDDPDTIASAAHGLAKELRECLVVLREIPSEVDETVAARLSGRAAKKLKAVR